MNVLVTGATGFLGSHLVKALLQDGTRVVILKRSFSNTERLTEVMPQLISYDLDCTSLDVPFSENGGIDAIIHTATNYGRNNESFSKIVNDNLIFPLQLLETAIAFDTKVFINTDTFSNTTFVRSNLLGYHLTKKHFAEWGRHIAKRCQMKFVNMRLEHIYGPSDSDSKFVPFVIKSCLQQTEELLLTFGEQMRDFIYIDDVVSAYQTVLKRAKELPRTFETVQVGRGAATTIREFVELVHHISQTKTVLKFGAIPYPKNEIMFSQANPELLTALGWACKVDLAAGIQAIIDHYKKS